MDTPEVPCQVRLDFGSQDVKELVKLFHGIDSFESELVNGVRPIFSR